MDKTTSIVIPARDEAEAIGPLVEEAGRVMESHAFEVIVVDDGSQDGTDAVLSALAARLDWLRPLRNPSSLGQSAAIRRGVRAARGQVIVTLDGDGQNPPDQIPVVLAPLRADGAGEIGLVQGQRKARRDSLAKRMGSRIANAIRQALLRDGVRDSGCGLKAFRRDAYLDLPWFDHVHRFMPAMMLREGWKVATVDVAHRRRQGGRSKYNNLQRALVGVSDLLGAAWLTRRARALPRPPSGTAHAAPPDGQHPATRGGEGTYGN